MMSSPLILRLNKSGQPIDWLSKKDAVCIYVKDHISWSMGKHVIPVYGGTNRSGCRSVIHLPSIIATVGEVHKLQDDNIELLCQGSSKMELIRRIASLETRVEDMNIVPPRLDEIYNHFMETN